MFACLSLSKNSFLFLFFFPSTHPKIPCDWCWLLSNQSILLPSLMSSLISSSHVSFGSEWRVIKQQNSEWVINSIEASEKKNKVLLGFYDVALRNARRSNHSKICCKVSLAHHKLASAVLFGYVKFLKYRLFARRNDLSVPRDSVTGHLVLGNSANLERQLDSFDFSFRIQSRKPTSNRGAHQISSDYTTGCLYSWDEEARGARGVRANLLQAAVKTTEEEKEDETATSCKKITSKQSRNATRENAFAKVRWVDPVLQKRMRKVRPDWLNLGPHRRPPGCKHWLWMEM